MMDPPDLAPILRQRRAARGWTLDDLAEHSGVSRSMVSLIERGQANPTFATLWNLTQALGIDLHELSEPGPTPADGWIDVEPQNRTPRMETDDGLGVLRILSPVETVGSAEWYELTIAPEGRLVSTPHAPGTVEHLSVLRGALRVTAGRAEAEVGEGATARYPGDVDHEIHNPRPTPARALLVVLTKGVRQ